MAAESCIIFITTIEAIFDGFAQQLDWREFEVTHARALDLLPVITLEFWRILLAFDGTAMRRACCILLPVTPSE
jgi:hypothetical protein